jgi:hypothetical protein
MNHRANNTVSTEMSGADSVLPSLAGWEKTKPVLRRGSSHHEAYLPGSRVTRVRRAYGRRLDEDSLALMALGPQLAGGG